MCGTDPENVDTGGDGLYDMLARGDLGGRHHAGLGLDPGEPFEAFLADTFKAAGVGAWFPDAGAIDFHAVFGELPRGCHYLFFGLGAARAGDYDGFAVVESGE